MDKSWMDMPRNTLEYIQGVENFLDFAYAQARPGVQSIPCPCPGCCCNKKLTRDKVFDHLLRRSFPVQYKIWDIHREKRGDGGHRVIIRQ